LVLQSPARGTVLWLLCTVWLLLLLLLLQSWSVPWLQPPASLAASLHMLPVLLPTAG
jgi:hypothetical protein